MSDVKKFIHVQFVKEGSHFYPDAATSDKLATGNEYDVSALANLHYHYFYFKVWIQVLHNNRDLEFIQFRRWLENLYNKKTLDVNHKSCEMIAEDLYHMIHLEYPGREIRIDVSEDNINGAYLEFPNG